MNPRILLVVILLLLAAAWGLTRLGGEPSAPAAGGGDAARTAARAGAGQDPASAGPLLALPADQVAELLIHQSDRLAVLRLVPGEHGLWTLTEPLVDQAEPFLVASLLHALLELEAPTLDPGWAVASDEELGLTEPGQVVEVRTHDGALHRIRFGAQVPGDAGRFALVDGVRAQAPSQLAVMLERAPDLWRSHALLRWPRGAWRIEWRPADGPGFLVERSGNAWGIVDPVHGPLDPRRVKTLERLIGTRCSSLPTDRTPAEVQERLIQEAGVLRATMRMPDGNERVQTLHVVRDNLLLDAERGFLLPVYPDDVDLLQLRGEELRSRRLLDFDPRQISSLRLTRPEGRIEMTRSSQGWRDEDGELLSAAAAQALTGLLVSLAEVEAVEPVERPDGVEARQVLLSLASRPVERNATRLWWWPLPDGGCAVATSDSRRHYRTARDWDAAWAEVVDALD